MPYILVLLLFFTGAILFVFFRRITKRDYPPYDNEEKARKRISEISAKFYEVVFQRSEFIVETSWENIGALGSLNHAVRVKRPPFNGRIGFITSIPQYDLDLKKTVVYVAFDDGTYVPVSFKDVEIISIEE